MAEQAIQVAKMGISKAISKLDSNSAEDAKLSEEWFGLRSSADAAAVKSNYQRALGAAAFAHFWCPVSNSLDFMWEMGELAAVHTSAPNQIFLTPGFFERNTAGVDSQGGAMAHELMHIIGIGLHPEIYGTADTKTLAVNNSSGARNSADNYQYYIESILFGIK